MAGGRFGKTDRIIRLVIIKGKRFWNHLAEYCDKIIADIRGATAIQFFEIVSIENAQRKTDLEISERVLNRFLLRSRFDLS